MRKLILASSSPRRIQILKNAGFNFEVIPPAIEEEAQGPPVVRARILAKKKALSVWRKFRDSVVIGADTLVFVGEKVIGKPKDPQEAKDILAFLSGRTHKVVTAVCVLSKEKRVVFHDVAKVKFRKLSKQEIESYVASGEPLDKAGSYGVQGFGAVIVERIVGNFYTVMGLPIHMLYPILKNLLPQL